MKTRLRSRRSDTEQVFTPLQIAYIKELLADQRKELGKESAKDTTVSYLYQTSAMHASVYRDMQEYGRMVANGFLASYERRCTLQERKWPLFVAKEFFGQYFLYKERTIQYASSLDLQRIPDLLEIRTENSDNLFVRVPVPETVRTACANIHVRYEDTEEYIRCLGHRGGAFCERYVGGIDSVWSITDELLCDYFDQGISSAIRNNIFECCMAVSKERMDNAYCNLKYLGVAHERCCSYDMNYAIAAVALSVVSGYAVQDEMSNMCGMLTDDTLSVSRRLVEETLRFVLVKTRAKYSRVLRDICPPSAVKDLRLLYKNRYMPSVTIPQRNGMDSREINMTHYFLDAGWSVTEPLHVRGLEDPGPAEGYLQKEIEWSVSDIPVLGPPLDLLSFFAHRKGEEDKITVERDPSGATFVLSRIVYITARVNPHWFWVLTGIEDLYRANQVGYNAEQFVRKWAKYCNEYTELHEKGIIRGNIESRLLDVLIYRVRRPEQSQI